MEGMLSQGFSRDKAIESYIKELREARWAARVVGLQHSFSRFLAFCNLTWATVILLGAFVSSLHLADYFFVSALLLLEAARLASSAFFIQLLNHSTDPSHLNHDQQVTEDEFTREQRARFLSPFLQVLLIASSFICSMIRLLNAHFYDPHFINHLQMSLRIFYTLIIVNVAISCLALLCSIMAWMGLKHASEQSVLRYYDEVLQNALDNGVLQADNFNFFQFAFKMLGRDYAKCKAWTVVVKAHQKMLRYIYAHKQGADYLQICLDSEDASVRQAAANTVGVWADKKRGLGLEEFELPPELLTKLADMVGTGEVGWAVTNSFGGLAKRNPQILLQTLTSSKQLVLHRIAELVNGSSKRSLAFVRTLVHFYDKIYSQQRSMVQSGAAGMTDTPEALPQDIQDDLVGKLKHLLQWSSVQRLRVQSAYLLYLLGKLDQPCYDLIRSITPSNDGYWYAMEQEMLEFFLKEMPPPPAGTSPHFVKLQPPPARPAGPSPEFFRVIMLASPPARPSPHFFKWRPKRAATLSHDDNDCAEVYFGKCSEEISRRLPPPHLP